MPCALSISNCSKDYLMIRKKNWTTDLEFRNKISRVGGVLLEGSKQLLDSVSTCQHHGPLVNGTEPHTPGGQHGGGHCL